LTLYGRHQQSQHGKPVHRVGVGVGTAVRALHAKFGKEAVDRRFQGAVSANSVESLARHLSVLIGQLHAMPSAQALDYSQLVEDMSKWQYSESRTEVRRRWGRQYHSRKEDDTGRESGTGEVSSV
jgi:CRISPR system Cascade subunit CasB